MIVLCFCHALPASFVRRSLRRFRVNARVILELIETVHWAPCSPRNLLCIHGKPNTAYSICYSALAVPDPHHLSIYFSFECSHSISSHSCLANIAFFPFVRLLTLAARFSTGVRNFPHPGLESTGQIICVGNRKSKLRRTVTLF